jgi:formylglycine-generating enzyme required for sulfatase activity
MLATVLSGCSKPPKSVVKKPEIVSSLGIEFIRVPGGTFNMGAEEFERPVHPVRISSFLMSKYEITNEQFETFKKVKRSRWSAEDRMPVAAVSRAEVLAFIEWLSMRDGRKYALPTEAQWEYAARAGTNGTSFPWGNDWRDGMGHIGGREWDTTAMNVGSFPANAYGLHDLIGNVSEMVRERYEEYKPGFRVDPVGLVQEPSDIPYVVRGLGIHDYFPWVWFRFRMYDDMLFKPITFRLVVIEDVKAE